jgi:hypothetical protein
MGLEAFNIHKILVLKYGFFTRNGMPFALASSLIDTKEDAFVCPSKSQSSLGTQDQSNLYQEDIDRHGRRAKLERIELC